MAIPAHFDTLELGATPEPHVLDSREDYRAFSARLVQQARRTVDICSRSMDPMVFEDPGLLSGLKDVAMAGRFARVRILLLDPEPVYRRGHRVLELAQRLSSYIDIRVPGPDHRDFNQAFIVADERGYVHQRLSDRYEGVADFGDRPYAEELLRQFEDLWTHSDADPNLNRLAL